MPAATVSKTPVPVDPWQTPKESWQYVTIPEEDATGKKYPDITLNKISFSAGQTYQVPPSVYQFVQDRIKAYNKSVIRLFNPKADLEALRVVPVGSAPGGVTAYVDASQINTL